MLAMKHTITKQHDTRSSFTATLQPDSGKTSKPRGKYL